MIHLHEVRDTDTHFEIDPITRAISNANSAKNKLMQGDHNSEIYTFEIPRHVESHDMTLCNAVRIHFNDISADKANESKGVYPVEDMHIDEGAEDTLVFSWTISGNATEYAGLLSFRIQFLCINDNGDVTYKWHTDIFKGITISDGFDNAEADIEQYSDILMAWEERLFGAGDSAINEIKAAADKQMYAVEAKGAETLATIPDDYTELYGMANDALRTRANAIVENVEGDALIANDCSSDHLRQLRIFGRSTQDGAPTPDAPVEIKSVVEPVVTVCGKNLLPYPYIFNTFTKDGVTITANTDGTITVNGTASANVWLGITESVVLSAGTYTLSIFPDDWVAENGYVLWQGKNTHTGTLTATIKEATSEGVGVVLLNGVTYNNVVLRPQIECGSVATEYEPYNGGVIELTNTLPGIPVTSGGNYTDSDGQQWICDEVDLARGVYVQRISSTDLTDADWTQNSSGKYFSAKNRGIYSSAYKVMCTHISGGNASDGNKENVIFINANNDIRLNITLDENTIEAVTNAMNGATLIGVLASPVETTLTNAEIFAFKMLHSNYPNTTILNDAGAWMEAAYNADTELFFNNSRGASDEQVANSVDVWLQAHFPNVAEVGM